MYNKFETHIQKIKDYLENHNTPIVRILYTEDSGEISSLTIPSSKIISNTTDRLMSIFMVCDELLYPDIQTAFIDPTSVQENFCIIGNFHADTRNLLVNKEIDIDTTVNFNMTNNEVYAKDLFHDLRNELIIEAIKAGINMTSHYTVDNRIQTFRFSTNHLLDLADAIQKIKFLINCIVGSYGQGFFLKDENNNLIFKNKDKQILTRTMGMNPYLYLKSL